MPPKSKKQLAAELREAREAEKKIPLVEHVEVYKSPQYKPQDPSLQPYWDAFYKNPYPDLCQCKLLSERLKMGPRTVEQWFIMAQQFTHVLDKSHNNDVEIEETEEEEANREGEKLGNELLIEGTLYRYFYHSGQVGGGWSCGCAGDAIWSVYLAVFVLASMLTVGGAMASRTGRPTHQAHQFKTMSILVPQTNNATTTKTQLKDPSDSYITTIVSSHEMLSKVDSPPAHGNESQPQHGVTDTFPNRECSPTSETPNVRFPLETLPRLEHGDELGRNGRFWTMYVKDTNEWDAELVDKWNKSLDVILGKILIRLLKNSKRTKTIHACLFSTVFAALFSAISTAFLIETSKKLQEDPTDVSAQTLIVISQTLLTLVNNTSSESAVPTPMNNAPFSPSRMVVLVNTLWYMSLSVSVGASFLAMLAKDWCHTFMAGRKGDLWIQARRRQRKWTMIEKWKMQELIMVLPSLIHLSLLLFAIGLCVYVWELNKAVAIPVCCICGAAVVFYVLSSLAAAVLEHFPYTTLVSTILRSGIMKPFYAFLRFLIIVICSGIFILLLFTLLFIGALWYTCFPSMLYTLYDKWLSALERYFAFMHARSPTEPSLEEYDNMRPEQDEYTSLALSWVIANCQEPASVDLALQAIADVDPRLAREPLEKCNAATAIARRLGSSSFHSVPDRHRQLNYIHALAFFGNQAPATIDDQASAGKHDLGDIKNMSRLLHINNERRVTSMITDGKLTGNEHNFLALNIGSRAASCVLEVVKGSTSFSNWAFPHIARLLVEYTQPQHGQFDPLHPASILSLAHAGSLLTVYCPPKDRLDTPNIAFQLLLPILSIPFDPKSDLYRLSSMLIVSALSHSQRMRSRESSPPNHTTSTAESLRALLAYSRMTLSPAAFWFGVLELSSRPEVYNCTGDYEGTWPWWSDFQHELHKLSHININLCAIRGVSFVFDSLVPQNEELPNNTVDHLKSINCVFQGAQITTPPVALYVLVVETQCRDRFSIRGIAQCSEMLSQYAFPQLSADLVAYLHSRDIVVYLAEGQSLSKTG
ncbi:unnamed protein product [Rhizoctonia solani]|uniref:DUF6535 domain-containing protein n=1 Tax=Rhizoctonia solani TaxID=456999 RepID=A0A8H3GVG8_9AGAM|nr:unnamed protein product [Rhizoctonia solani]